MTFSSFICPEIQRFIKPVIWKHSSINYIKTVMHEVYFIHIKKNFSLRIKQFDLKICKISPVLKLSLVFILKMFWPVSNGIWASCFRDILHVSIEKSAFCWANLSNSQLHFYKLKFEHYIQKLRIYLYHSFINKNQSNWKAKYQWINIRSGWKRFKVAIC